MATSAWLRTAVQHALRTLVLGQPQWAMASTPDLEANSVRAVDYRKCLCDLVSGDAGLPWKPLGVFISDGVSNRDYRAVTKT